MSKKTPPVQEKNKPFHHRNGSGELDVFEAARYFTGANENFSGTNTILAQKYYLREDARRLSLDMPNHRRNAIPLQALIMENHPTRIKNEKKYKQPSSPGGKLAHFLNTLFNQTSSKKSKSKSIASTQSMKDENENPSPSSWRRKRRSSISLFWSGNSNTTTANTNTAIVTDTNPNYSRTPPPYHIAQTPTKTSSVITKIPINENHKKNENLKTKSGFSEKKRSSGNGLLEKVRVCDVKHDDHHHKYDPTVKVREFKRFIVDDNDDDGDSDSSSDLFELTNCDLSYYSSGLPVFETTHMDSIKRGAPITS